MINLHPSLLPAYGGMGMFGHKVHEAVIAAGEEKSGVTVHYVSDDVDGGKILMQEEIPLEPGETPESLEAKVHKVEYALYPRAIVAALTNLPEPQSSQSSHNSQSSQSSHNSQSSQSQTPPPMPAPAEEWAERLGVQYRPEKITPGNLKLRPSQ